MICYAPMSTATLDRLRRLQALRPQQTHSEPAALSAPQPRNPPVAVLGAPRGHLVDLVPGFELENSAGHCYVRVQSYSLQTGRGACALGDLLERVPALFAPFHPAFGLHEATRFQQAVFLDTETTGLGGGAGIYCFMVGVGTFERVESRDWRLETGDSIPSLQSPISNLPPTHFVVRQFLMRSPAEEGALLLALAELLDRCALSVTFNGRGFDLPLLRARFRQNQHIYPDLRGSGRLLAAEQPHLDLLLPARRLWRRRLQSCRLLHLEEAILGVQRGVDDVPGHLIPQIYTDYVRNGEAGELARVFYHNHEDILSMVALAEWLSQAFGGNQADALLQREDWLALGICYDDLGRYAEAEGAYRRALTTLRDPQSRGEAFQRLGQLLKRQGRWAEADTLWQEWLTTVPGHDATPYIELAKYYEWQRHDLEQATMWTAWALHHLRQSPAWQRPAGLLAELEHRRARLQRKQGTQGNK